MTKLAADLDAPRFKARERAFAELARVGPAARDVLRQFLAGKPSLDGRRRAEELLARLEEQAASDESLRIIRAVEVAEQIATPAARELLVSLSRGVPEARLTHEAKMALRRLARSPSPPPWALRGEVEGQRARQ